MAQAYMQVMRQDLKPIIAPSEALVVTPTNPVDRTSFDELLAEAEEGQQALAKRLGEPALITTVISKPSIWVTMPLPCDESFVRYDHDTSRWLEDWE